MVNIINLGDRQLQLQCCECVVYHSSYNGVYIHNNIKVLTIMDFVAISLENYNLYETSDASNDYETSSYAGPRFYKNTNSIM